MSALALTIVTATHRSRITGVSPARATEMRHSYPKYRNTPLEYRHDGEAVAAMLLVWLGWVCVAASCVLLFISSNNTERASRPRSPRVGGDENAHRRPNCSAHDDPEAAMSDQEKSMQKHESTDKMPEQASEQDRVPSVTAPAAEH
ncbi:hypothetical protein LTR87_005059 [Friedmanniomyces endolithicus]|nr:hypothetical protein LTR87_005059 [Friedmanniomyces endolithicus]